MLPGPTVDAVALAQHVLAIALVVAVFLVTDRCFGRIAAILAATLTGLAPSMMLVEHYVIPDFLLRIVVLAGTVVLIEGAVPRRPSIRALVLAGALFGLAAHIKPNGQVLIAVAPLVLAFATRSWRETLRGSAAVAAATVLMVVPWVIHNAVKYGHPVVSVQGGQTLWLRVFDQDRLPIPTDSPEGRLTNRMYNRYFKHPPPGYAEPSTAVTTESYQYVNNALARRGYSPYEATKTQGELALQAIKAHVGEYLSGTWRNIREYASLGRSFESAELLTAQHVDHVQLGVPKFLATKAWDVGSLLARLMWVLSLALLATPALLFVGSRRARVAAVAFIVVWGVMAVGSSLTNHVEPRFAAQISPLLWILEAAAAVLVVSAIIDLIRRRRGVPATD